METAIGDSECIPATGNLSLISATHFLRENTKSTILRGFLVDLHLKNSWNNSKFFQMFQKYEQKLMKSSNIHNFYTIYLLQMRQINK